MKNQGFDRIERLRIEAVNDPHGVAIRHLANALRRYGAEPNAAGMREINEAFTTLMASPNPRKGRNAMIEGLEKRLNDAGIVVMTYSDTGEYLLHADGRGRIGSVLPSESGGSWIPFKANGENQLERIGEADYPERDEALAAFVDSYESAAQAV